MNDRVAYRTTTSNRYEPDAPAEWIPAGIINSLAGASGSYEPSAIQSVQRSRDILRARRPRLQGSPPAASSSATRRYLRSQDGFKASTSRVLRFYGLAGLSERHFRGVVDRLLGVRDGVSTGPPPRASWSGCVQGTTAEIRPIPQGARANRPDHGAVQPTKPRSNSRAKAISVNPPRRAGLRFLSQKLCIKA